MLKPLTFLPFFIIVPPISWPGIMGSETLGKNPSCVSISLKQTPVYFCSIVTSLFRGLVVHNLLKLFQNLIFPEIQLSFLKISNIYLKIVKNKN